MKQALMDKINQECAKLKKRQKSTLYELPEEEFISIGDETIINGIYLSDEDYKGVPFANGYLESSEVNFNLAFDAMSDEIGQQILHILATANLPKRYRPRDLRSILDQMYDYICHCQEEEIKGYFEEITNTGLFTDAVGKIAEYGKEGTYVDVLEEY